MNRRFHETVNEQKVPKRVSVVSQSVLPARAVSSRKVPCDNPYEQASVLVDQLSCVRLPRNGAEI